MTGQPIEIARRRPGGREDLGVSLGEATATFPFQRPQHDRRAAASMLSPDLVIDEGDDLVGQADCNLCTHPVDGTNLVYLWDPIRATNE